jgi:hypothetical protein
MATKITAIANASWAQTMRLLLAFCAALGLFVPAPAHAAATVTDMVLVSYVWTQRSAVDATFTITVQNGSPALVAAEATVQSNSPASVVIKGTVKLGAIAAGAKLTSTDTFTIRQDRNLRFDPSALVWTVRDVLPNPEAGAPALLFSDLVSGPNSGNSDDSQPGQVAGLDGAIVTLWGRNLGATAGTVKVAGIAARIYSWGQATAPADLSTRHGLQMVVFQVPSSAPLGTVDIELSVAGVNSNPLPFVIRPGAMRYVRVGGNDGGDGTYQRPWAKVSVAALRLLPGDILYLGDGVVQSAQEGDRSTMDLDRDAAAFGTRLLPKAIVGYPGATARIGTDTLDAWSTFVSGSPTAAVWWTMSKLVLTGRNVAAAYNTGFRLVGNRVSAPLGNDQTGAIGGLDSADLYVLGNELTSCGYPGTSKLYHPMYIQSNERSVPPRLPNSDNREIAWNYLHDNAAYDGINLYREGQYSAYMTRTRVHDNWIENQTGRGMLIGTYLTGHDNHFYNNVILRAGLGPVPAPPFQNDPAFGYVCVDINAGAVDNPPTTIHFYNNTLVGCGFSGGPLNSAGAMAIGNAYAFDLDFRNNLIVTMGFPFVTAYSTAARTQAAKNLWSGDGGSTTDPATAALFAGRVLGEPDLLNPAAGNLRLGPNSAALDRGSATGVVPGNDFDGVPRPQGAGIDIGAFERRALIR